MELELKMTLIREYREYPFPSYNTLAKKYGLNSWQVMYVFTRPTEDMAEIVADSVKKHEEGRTNLRMSDRMTRIEAVRTGGRSSNPNKEKREFEEFWKVRDGQLVYDDTPEEAAQKLLEMERNGKQTKPD